MTEGTISQLGNDGTPIDVDICIIGAGSGGLSVAAGAVQMGATVALFERGEMGGDCLNYGCVPSKSLLAAAARAVGAGGDGSVFGINQSDLAVDFGAVQRHVKSVIASIAPHDSVERFEALGVQVFREAAQFDSPNSLIGSGGTVVRAKRFVIATGSSPMVPPIDGLQSVPYLTNETIFDVTDLPRHLIIIGGGPIGIEMAQAFCRLGSQVTVLEMGAALPKDDPDLAAVVKRRLVAEGIELIEGAKVESVANVDSGDVDDNNVDTANAMSAIEVSWSDGNQTNQTRGSHLLVAAGRRPNVNELGLEAAGVSYSPRGIDVNSRLRTNNRRIYAIGDVIGQYQFTHAAGYHAGIVIRNMLFRLPAKADYSALPWVTYTDPELAHVGVSSADALDGGRDVRILTASFDDNDRARAERQTDGMIKVVTSRRGRILGATIVGYHAGELILPWALAISNKMKIGTMASVIAPYPTFSEISKRAAGSYYTPSLFSQRTRRIVRLLLRFG